MKEGLLISHHGENSVEPIAVISVDASDAEVDRVILKSLQGWCCPPEDFCLVHDNDTIFIEYKDGHEDECDGAFTTNEVDVDI